MPSANATLAKKIAQTMPHGQALRPVAEKPTLRSNQVQAAREHLVPFSEAVDPNSKEQKGGGYGAKHLRLIAEKLEAVERGEITRLMIFMPPRHWKSSLCSEKFPAWFLGRNPKKKIIATSYADTLAIDFSSKVRDTIGENADFKEIFPKVKLKRGSKSKANWSLVGSYRSSYRAAGLAGGITGRGGDLIIIDDPVADDQAVATKAQRDKLYSWYQAKLRTRLEPGGAIILIMTRWHEDDLAGRLLEAARKGEGEQWEVVSLPALAEPIPVTKGPKEPLIGVRAPLDVIKERVKALTTPNDPEAAEGDSGVSPAIIQQIDAVGRKQGEPLWPERYSLEEYAAMRLSVGAKHWAAEYQQRPRPDSGNILDSTLLRMIEAKDVPILVKKFRCWDLAFSEKDGADSLAGVLGGIDRAGNLYILHIKVLHGSWPVNKPKIVTLSHFDGPQTIVSVESNGTQLGYYQDLKADPKMKLRRVVSYKPAGDKPMRASLWGAHLDPGPHGKIFCVRGEWNLAFFDEMDGFPNAAHDDMIDGVSQLWIQTFTRVGGGMHSA